MSHPVHCNASGPADPHAGLFQRFIFSPFTLACKCLSFYCLFECLSCSVSSVCPPMCVKLFNKPCEQSDLQAVSLFLFLFLFFFFFCLDALKLLEHKAPNMEGFSY